VKSLLFRLTAAFAVVLFVSIAIIYVVANLATTNEFRGYMFRGGMAATDQIAHDLGVYYAAHGSWQGVDTYLTQSLDSGMGGMMGRGGMGFGMMGAPLFLADANGVVVAGRGTGTVLGQKVSSAQLENGTPIIVDGITVGTLVDSAPVSSAFDAQQQEFLRRVNMSILVAGVAGGLIALLLGFGLFYQITAPLNALAAASRKIAGGDLTARVNNPRADEIGQVGQAFNAMAESLAQSEGARRNMIADIAHELRNPLGVLQGQLEGMIDGVFPTTSEQIASLYDDTLLLTRLVSDLRDLALADAGQLQISRQSVDIGGLIGKTVAAFAVEAAERNILLKEEVPASLPPVRVDAQRIEQVLRNFIGNALRHTPEGGTIRVGCAPDRAQPSRLVVEVSDTGSGIPAADLPHVFERFWRGDKSRSRAGGGAGLGLAIAKQIVIAHEGEIGAKSNPGPGATFWFTLPIE
jgi:two-component system OmpR family sensor kinase